MFGRRRLTRDSDEVAIRELREVRRNGDLNHANAMARLQLDHASAMARLEEAKEERRWYFEAIRVEQKAEREKLDEIIAENRVQREALFRMLDKLDGKGGPATA